jgi:hypothetical protein
MIHYKAIFGCVIFRNFSEFRKSIRQISNIWQFNVVQRRGMSIFAAILGLNKSFAALLFYSGHLDD